MMKTLAWAKLDYDEGPDRPGKFGPYIQSERSSTYDHHMRRLLESKNAYRCFCSPERLSQMRENFKQSGSNLTYDRKCLKLSEEEIQDKLSRGISHVIRLKNPDQQVTLDDLVYGKLNFLNNTQDDVILIKTDGMPTYHFANVVDDHEMKISHVLRGEEWLSSTPKHVLLYQALGFSLPKFAHLPLLVNADGSKLSKRSGDVRVEDYMQKGYEPEALLNFVALMGLNHAPNSKGHDRVAEGSSPDLMTMNQMIQAFSISSVGKQRSTVSQPKLDYLNQQHIARKIELGNAQETKDLIDRTKALLSLKPSSPNASESIPDSYIHKVLYLLKERLHLFSDLKYLSEYFFYLPDLTTPEAKALRKTIPDQVYGAVLNAVLNELPSVLGNDDDFNVESISEILKSAQGRISTPITNKVFMGALRHAITGRKVGAGMAPTISVLGKSRTVGRIKAAIKCAS